MSTSQNISFKCLIHQDMDANSETHHENISVEQDTQDRVQYCCSCCQDVAAWPRIKDSGDVRMTWIETIHGLHGGS